MILGYNFTIRVWYIVSAEEIKGQSFSSAGFHFSKAFPINFIICLTPYRKASITGAFFIKESEDNMGVRVVFPDMGKDPSIQLIEKTITENGTYDAITDGANGYSKVNVNVEGGGGESDFSTAEVTINDTDGAGWLIIGAFILDRDSDSTIYPQIYSDEEESIQLALYKGKSVIAFPNNSAGDVTVSGDAVNNGDNITVTGDCTITIS